MVMTSSKRIPRKGGSNFSLRASNIGIIQQAKTRTLKMTIVIGKTIAEETKEVKKRKTLEVK